MEGKQNIYYALGILAFAVAKADGEIQDEEKNKLFKIVNDETDHDLDFEYAEIIFQLLQRDKLGVDHVYEWALKEIDKGRHYLSPEIKQKMIDVLYKIADAFDHISEDEAKIIHQFENDIKDMGSSHFLKK